MSDGWKHTAKYKGWGKASFKSGNYFKNTRKLFSPLYNLDHVLIYVAWKSFRFVELKDGSE
jgi:hypothetical protein